MKILPPTLFLICLICMVASHWIIPIMQIIIFPYNLTGILLIILGISISFAGSKKFQKKDTNIDTFKDPDKLVTDGLYKYSRNPMYLGFAVALLGLAIVLSTITPCFFFLLFVVFTDRCYIKYEETKLIGKFGSNFFEYKSKVRKWL